ncbi:hypothetical protein DPX16_17969 [Anabarilius grahami]|uniref:Tc3 transposase DNA binding domain-containing protein n=1 Tax=Anabarilius grahami TaxID=495550 RepID=A0A3N0XT00_ANAGA|nr:hypothetical protein DPX16_17969 [Anabarilius grahami]
MGKRKDLSEFDKGQIVMARRLGQSIYKTAALVGCSQSAVGSIYQKWSKEGTVVNRRQGHGRPRLIDARGERRLARVVRSNRRATGNQTPILSHVHVCIILTQHVIESTRCLLPDVFLSDCDWYPPEREKNSTVQCLSVSR